MIPTITVVRTNERTAASYDAPRKRLAYGRRLVVTMPPLEPLCGIEREGFVWARPAGYVARVGVMTSGLRGLQLTLRGHERADFDAGADRFWGSLRSGRLWAHPANVAAELDGCLSFGVERTKRGVGRCGEAFARIFDVLGGFEPGTEVRIRIANRPGGGGEWTSTS